MEDLLDFADIVVRCNGPVYLSNIWNIFNLSEKSMMVNREHYLIVQRLEVTFGLFFFKTKLKLLSCCFCFFFYFKIL